MSDAPQDNQEDEIDITETEEIRIKGHGTPQTDPAHGTPQIDPHGTPQTDPGHGTPQNIHGS